MLQAIEAPIKRYLQYFHGAPSDPKRQFDYYRCEFCRGIVTWKQIHQGGCKSCSVGSRVRAAHLSIWEKAQLLLMPWTV